MADWQLINITWYIHSYYWLTVESWETIARVAGISGVAKTMAEWGITSDDSFWSGETAIYVPQGSDIGFAYRCGNGSDCYLTAIDMTQSTLTTKGRIVGGLRYTTTTMTARMLVNEDFWVVANTSERTDSGVMGMANFLKVSDRNEVTCFFTSLYNAQTDCVYDINGGVVASIMVSGNRFSLSDGALYLELIKLMANTDDEVYIANNIYQMYYTYQRSEKKVLINGIRFTSANTTELYFPTE